MSFKNFLWCNFVGCHYPACMSNDWIFYSLHHLLGQVWLIQDDSCGLFSNKYLITFQIIDINGITVVYVMEGYGMRQAICTPHFNYRDTPVLCHLLYTKISSTIYIPYIETHRYLYLYMLSRGDIQTLFHQLPVILLVIKSVFDCSSLCGWIIWQAVFSYYS